MNEMARIVEQLEFITAELERLRVLKEHELGVRIEQSGGGVDPRVVPKVEE
jgi:hypothetical protein